MDDAQEDFDREHRAAQAQTKLTEYERRCCHMRDAAFDWTPNAIERWRDEFKKIARSEKCYDCPLCERNGQ